MSTATAPAPAPPPTTHPADAPRPGCCRATGVSRAGAVSPNPPTTTPCHADPAGWEVRGGGDLKTTAALIRAAATGCAICLRTHPDAYRACAETPRKRRSPLTVMAGNVVTVTGAIVRPGRYIRTFLPRLRSDTTP